MVSLSRNVRGPGLNGFAKVASCPYANPAPHLTLVSLTYVSYTSPVASPLAVPAHCGYFMVLNVERIIEDVENPDGVPRYIGQGNPYAAYVSVFNGNTGVSKDWRDI
jgi:hypothetical protein